MIPPSDPEAQAAVVRQLVEAYEGSPWDWQQDDLSETIQALQCLVGFKTWEDLETPAQTELEQAIGAAHV